MIRRPPRSTRTDTLFPTRRASDLIFGRSIWQQPDPGLALRALCAMVHEDASVSEALEMARSEEHTSELQSLMRISYAVFCLKKKKTPYERSTQLCTETDTTIRYNSHIN